MARHLELWLAGCLAWQVMTSDARADDKADEEMLKNLDFFYYMDAVESQELLESSESIEATAAEGNDDDGTNAK